MIGNILANPAIYRVSQNTVSQVSVETMLKAAGRPSFILADNNIDKNTKKYSATKEFLYQLICLSLYLALIIPVFKKSAFAMARKVFKDEAVLKAFETPAKFDEYLKLKDLEKFAKIKEINEKLGLKDKDKITKDKINENLGKGIIDLSSIIGSVVGLAILSPLISMPLIHPMLKAFGLSDPKEKVNENAKENVEKPLVADSTLK